MNTDYTKNPFGEIGYLSLGSTQKFSIVQIKGDVFIEDLRGDDSTNPPRLPLAEELANLYINQLYSYLDEDPDNQEDVRIYNMNLFDQMCSDYFKEVEEEKRILDSI